MQLKLLIQKGMPQTIFGGQPFVWYPPRLVYCLFKCQILLQTFHSY